MTKINVVYLDQPTKIFVRRAIPDVVYQEASSADAMRLLLSDVNVSSNLKSALRKEYEYWDNELREEVPYGDAPDFHDLEDLEDLSYEDLSRGY